MEVTDKIIMDLLPLYFSGEASEDTSALIKSYFNNHPKFAKEAQKHFSKNLPNDIPVTLKPEDEMIILRKTKKLLRFRTLFLFIAIFCTASLFAFGNVTWDGVDGVHWLWLKYPQGAIIAGIIGLFSWIGYFMIRNRLRTTAI